LSPEQEASIGLKAERLLEELSPYTGMVRQAILDKWQNSPIGDKEGQHELRLMIKLLTDLEANIKTAIDTGKLARIQLERESIIDRARNVVRKFA
jgi:hypothetical protein